MTISARLSAELAPLVAQRAYPVVAPQSVELPYIVWQQIANVREGLFSGGVNFTSFRVQVSIVGASYDEIETLRSQVLGKVRSMPEHIPDIDEIDSDGYDEQVDRFIWTLDFRFRLAD